MKKSKKFMIIFMFTVLILIICIIIINREPCEVEGCNNRKLENSKFCIDHTCGLSNCPNQKRDNMIFCDYHLDYYSNDNKKDDSEYDTTVLTDNQLKQARAAVDDYIKLLMEKQSNILGVNIIRDVPEVSGTYIKYECNVVREDDNINLATISVLMESDGNFKVTGLTYND